MLLTLGAIGVTLYLVKTVFMFLIYLIQGIIKGFKEANYNSLWVFFYT